MKKCGIAAVAALLVLAAAVASAAAAATTSIPLPLCANGGTINVPAGNTIDLRFGEAAKNRGLVQDFLNAQRTTLSVNGVAVANLDSYFGPIVDAGDFSFVF